MAAHPITTVLGPRELDGDASVDTHANVDPHVYVDPNVYVDAHAHLWISRVEGGPADAPVLDDAPAIRDELAAFAAAGGRAAIDCQPPGAGRDARRLVWLAEQTGVAVVAATGFHLRRYHAEADSPWTRDADLLVDRFTAELTVGMEDPDGGRLAARAGVVKAAHAGTLGRDGERMLVAAAAAAHAAGALLVIHTERGAGVEGLAALLLEQPLPAASVMLCHVDKRPDARLHAELARAGFLLEYDTFMRPKYAPRDNVWPLLEALLADGHERSIACALDLADHALWRFGGDPVGMAGLPDVVAPELRRRGAGPAQVRRLTGANVVDRLQAAAATAPAATAPAATAPAATGPAATAPAATAPDPRASMARSA
ncbi:MAG: aryldialkylphosphatase [Conexibacter sp.]|nr:aryldialkylphosphatase [Conexibacter sp.]